MNNRSNSMNAPQTELYDRIQNFSFDQPDAPLSFSKRLARDQGWSWDYAQRAIEEYRKFAFLAVAAGHPATPSDQVDQVWHLHLSYTRSYWQEFCPNVLQTPLHHDPTRGGSSEKQKFDDWYSKTLASYGQFFGQAPPKDIWSEPKDRFGRDLHFVRINTQKNWLVPKPSWSWRQAQPKQAVILSFFFILALAIGGCEAASLPNPLDFRGTEFLTFYLLLSTAALILSSRLRAFLRLPQGTLEQRPVSLDVYETAYLAEGENRVVDTAIATLVQKEYVIVQSGQGSLTLNQPVEALSHPVERAVVRAIASDGEIVRVRSVAIQATHAIQDRLRQLELLVSPEQAFKAQTYPALLIVALLGLGIAKIGVGLSRGKPVGFLVVMCIVVAIVGLAFWRNPVRRSRYGDRVFQSLQARVRSTVVRSTDPHLPLAFALLGVTVLPNDMFADLKKVLAPVSTNSGDGGGDGGGGCGGGGCGGGGCGGCGGG